MKPSRSGSSQIRTSSALLSDYLRRSTHVDTAYNIEQIMERLFSPILRNQWKGGHLSCSQNLTNGRSSQNASVVPTKNCWDYDDRGAFQRSYDYLIKVRIGGTVTVQ